MRHGSLYTGGGGFDLAAYWLGWQNVFNVENNPFAHQVLQYRFEGTDRHGDIKKFNGKKYEFAIDVLSGGFPCQSFSLSGKGAMDLSLWKEMFRVIREVKPRVVLAENVLGLVVRKKGYALEVVCSDLESEGFNLLPPLIIPACSQGAPHRRNRVWIIAYSDSNEREHQLRSLGQKTGESYCKAHKWEWNRTDFIRTFSQADATNPNPSGLSKRVQSRGNCIQRKAKAFKGREHSRAYPKDDWAKFPTVSPISSRNDGLPSGLVRYSERQFERIRKGSIELSGNAISPQLAYEIFKAIEATLTKPQTEKQ